VSTSTTQLLVYARELLERADPMTAGIWPRATALLTRQALEADLDDFWRRRAPGVEDCSARAQMLCLPSHLSANPDLASRVSHAWSALSAACHAHAYELPPTSPELLRWLTTAEEFDAHVAALTDGAFALTPVGMRRK
jgi:transcriptional regulator GlxA family with amidase domain